MSLTLALSAGSTAFAHADENSGFIDGSSATLNLRNAYLNRNFVNPAYPSTAAPQNKAEARCSRNHRRHHLKLTVPVDTRAKMHFEVPRLMRCKSNI